MALNPSELEKWSDEITSNYSLAEEHVSKHGLQSVINTDKLTTTYDHIYSNKIPKEEKVTNQKASGRCWLFAATNVMRIKMIKKYNLSEFEFSQAHLLFYDKLEKANYFLNNIINTMDEDINGRLLSYLLQSPVNDNQFDMARNVIKKYGLMPKSAYPEKFFIFCYSSIKLVNYT